MLVGVVVEAFYSCFFEGSVHALDLAVGPGMFWFGQTVVDVGFGAGELEGVGAEQFSLLKSELDLGDCGASIAGRGEVDPVVGEYGMDFVRNGLDQGFEEVCRDPGCGSLVQFDESELRIWK